MPDERSTSTQRLSRQQIEALIYGTRGTPRFTQDSPILPDVWLRYAEQPLGHHELLITPYEDARLGSIRPGELARELKERLGRDDARRPLAPVGPSGGPPEIAYNQTTVVARLWFDELVRVVLPLSAWWFRMEDRADLLASLHAESGRAALLEALLAPRGKAGLPEDLLWMVHIIGTLEQIRAVAVGADDAALIGDDAAQQLSESDRRAYYRKLIDRVATLVRGLDGASWAVEKPMVWSVSLNRQATMTLFRSRGTVKADAAVRLFDIACGDLAWAVMDSGIDARHIAFRRRKADGRHEDQPFSDDQNATRVVATYDFTVVRTLLSEESHVDGAPPRVGKISMSVDDRERLRFRLQEGLDVDWELLGRLTRIPHTKTGYVEPGHEHGTHVAGILAGDCRKQPIDPPSEARPMGVCADLQLYDLRVLDANGEGDEFNVMAALQFVRYLTHTSRRCPWSGST